MMKRLEKGQDDNKHCIIILYLMSLLFNYVVLRCVVLWYVKLSCAALRCVMLCCGVLR